MVAASKLRAVQTRAENSRGLWQPFTALLGDAISMLFYTRCFILLTFVLFFCFTFSDLYDVYTLYVE